MKKNNPKIVLLTHEYPPFHGGVATYCHEISLAAQELQLPLEVWAPKNAQDAVQLNCGATLDILHTFQMARELAKRELTIPGSALILGSLGVHRAAMLLFAIGRLKGVRIYSLLHGSEIPKFKQSLFWGTIAKSFFKHVRAFFVPSKFTGALLKELFPGDWNIVLAKGAASSATTREVQRNRYPEPFKILTLARVHERKGQFESAKGLALLPKHWKSRIRYCVGGVGAPKYLNQISEYCYMNDLPFEYLGEVPESKLADVYADCDLFIMTSRLLPKSVEGFGLSYLEAGWHGKPAIAFRTGGVIEAVIHGKTGMILEENDFMGVAESVQKLLEDKELYQTFSANARAYARTFSWRETVRLIAKTVL